MTYRTNTIIVNIVAVDNSVVVNLTGEPIIPLLNGKNLQIKSIAFTPNSLILNTEDGTYHEYYRCHEKKDK